MTEEDLKRLSDLIADKMYCTKEVLTSEEAARYCGFSRSYLYKLSMRNEIPHYRPRGKMCYFDRRELEQWLRRNRISSNEEIERKARAYCQKGGVL